MAVIPKNLWKLLNQSIGQIHASMIPTDGKTTNHKDDVGQQGYLLYCVEKDRDWQYALQGIGLGVIQVLFLEKIIKKLFNWFTKFKKKFRIMFANTKIVFHIE